MLGVISANPDVNAMRIATHGGAPQKTMRGILHPQLLYVSHLQGVQGLHPNDTITCCTFCERLSRTCQQSCVYA